MQPKAPPRVCPHCDSKLKIVARAQSTKRAKVLSIIGSPLGAFVATVASILEIMLFESCHFYICGLLGLGTAGIFIGIARNMPKFTDVRCRKCGWQESIQVA